MKDKIVMFIRSPPTLSVERPKSFALVNNVEKPKPNTSEVARKKLLVTLQKRRNSGVMPHNYPQLGKPVKMMTSSRTVSINIYMFYTG